MVGLGDLPGGGESSRAVSVTGDGAIIAGWGNRFPTDPDRSSTVEAARWVVGAIEGLGFLPGLDTHSHGADISSDGSVVVGWSGDSSGDADAAVFASLLPGSPAVSGAVGDIASNISSSAGGSKIVIIEGSSDTQSNLDLANSTMADHAR